MKSFKQFTAESLLDQVQDLGDSSSPEKQKAFIDKHLVQVVPLPSPEYSIPEPIDFKKVSKKEAQRLADMDVEDNKAIYEESESELSDAQKEKREEIVLGLKKRMSEFKDKYGDRAKDVMYATATKMAMAEEEELEEGVISDLEKIVKSKSMGEIKFKNGKKQKVDLFSASAVVNAYKQLSTANKKKVEGMLSDQGKFKQFVSFAMQASK